MHGSEAQTEVGQSTSPRLKAALGSDLWQFPEMGKQEGPAHSSSMEDNGPPTPVGWTWGFLWFRGDFNYSSQHPLR